MKRILRCSAPAVIFFALIMMGCGGGGGSSSPPRPSPPANVSAAGGIGEVTVTWTAVAGAASYNIYYSPSPNVKKGTGTPVDNVTNGHSITGLAIGTKYYFVVTTVDANGESAESIEVSATPVLPSIPTDVRAFPGNTTATIRWTTVGGAASYNVYYSTTSGVTKTTGTKIPGATSGVSVTGLTNGTPYYFVVTASANGLESTESDMVTATPISPAPSVPSAPTGITGSAGAASATIAWTPLAGASYNIYYSTSSGVTKATGKKVIGATSPANVPNLIRGVAYYFVVTAENAAGESDVSYEVSVTPNAPNPVFSQADLAGTWSVRVLRSAPTPGWYSALMNIDNSGIVTVIGSGFGNLSPPDVSALSVASGTGMVAGVVTETGTDNNPTFHGKMSSRKNLIVGISTKGTSIALHIYVKRDPGITYSSADLASKSFGYQRIYTGSSHFWETAAGSTDALGRMTLASKEDSSGPLVPPAPNYATLSIDSSGIVTIDNESTFYGVMSSDKNTIVGTSTDAAGKYSLRVIQMRGQNYVIADLEGVNLAYAFHSESSSSWARATWSTDNSGHVTVLNIVNSDGTTGIPTPWTQAIDPQGNVTNATEPGTKGMLSYGKDLLVEVADYLTGSTMIIKVQ